MAVIILILLGLALAAFPTLRCALSHFILLVWYGAKDLYHFIRQRQFNLCSSGELVAYTGLFGKGKTLSAVHKVISAYRQYNGKTVWCPRRRKLVKQRVKVISNVSLSIPYEDFISLEQIVLAAERNREYDDEHDTLTVTLVLAVFHCPYLKFHSFSPPQSFVSKYTPFNPLRFHSHTSPKFFWAGLASESKGHQWIQFSQSRKKYSGSFTYGQKPSSQ